MLKTRLADNSDITAVLDLQALNLFLNLSPEQREAGFVTTPFTVTQLQDLLKLKGLFVLEDSNKQSNILGYTMATSWHYFSEWPIFPYMINRLVGTKYKGVIIQQDNSFQYGPVCVDSGLRGTDAFPRLFEEMRIHMAKLYPIGITFINKVNNRSYQAHRNKLKLDVIDEFEFNNNDYYGLAFETAKSVL